MFEAGARHANLTRAAEELGVSSTAVSLRIRDLERELGVELFRRRGPRIALTEAGGALAVQLAGLLDGIRAAVDECRSVAPPLRLTVSPTLAARWLQPRLASYRANADAPPIVLDVSTDARLVEGFDVAVRSGDRIWPGLCALPLAARMASPMLSPRLADAVGVSAPSELAALTLLPDDDWPRWFAAVGIKADLRYGPIRYPTQELAAAAAVAGEGVALLSPALFAPLMEAGQLIQPFAEAIPSSFADWVLIRRGEARRAVLELAQWLASERH
jgi:LysR family glycine cleavage system transcriptional activator